MEISVWMYLSFLFSVVFMNFIYQLYTQNNYWMYHSILNKEISVRTILHLLFSTVFIYLIYQVCKQSSYFNTYSSYYNSFSSPKIELNVLTVLFAVVFIYLASKKLNNGGMNMTEHEIETLLKNIVNTSSKTVMTMNETAESMQNVEKCRSVFDKKYYNWKQQRQKTIKEIEKYRKELDQVCQYAKFGETVGSCTSILGSLLRIWGPYYSSTASYVEYAWKMITFGNVLAPTSSIIENVVSELYLRNLATTVQKDVELTELLRSPLHDAQKLDDNFKSLFNESLGSNSRALKKGLRDAVESHGIVIRSIEAGRTASPNNYSRQYILKIIHLVQDAYQSVLEKLENPRIFRACESSVNMVTALCCSELHSNLRTREGQDFVQLKFALQNFCNKSSEIYVQEFSNMAINYITLKNSWRYAWFGKSNFHAPLQKLEDDLKTELRIIEQTV